MAPWGLLAGAAACILFPQVTSKALHCRCRLVGRLALCHCHRCRRPPAPNPH
eukprot:SM016175S02291  [mRNA]  locus=s16175:21:176:+ [translate_table: standard]